MPPEIVAAAAKAEQERVQRIVQSIQPLSKRVRGINLDSNPDATSPPLENIAAPTLVISAQDDLFNALPAPRFIASRIPHARLEVYETGGHLLVGYQQDVRKLVSEFVDAASFR